MKLDLDPRRVAGALVGVAASLTWTCSLAGVLRAAAGLEPGALAPASVFLTLAAVVAGLAGTSGTSRRGAAVLGGTLGLVGAFALAGFFPALLVPLLALVPSVAGASALGVWVARRLPGSLGESLGRRRVAWLALGVLSLVQLGRLGTYMNDAGSDWFVGTRHPFYAKHECANAYVFGAELAARGEANVYDPAHYPGLNPEAEPTTAMVGMAPEDPYQYPPPFLLLPELGISLTNDYLAIRSAWFGLNVTLCLGAVLALASWIGGRKGRIVGLLTPAVLFSFPVLHDFQYGQFHFASVALAVLGMLAVEKGRTRTGGALLAGAIASKLFPALLLVPLALQRRWRALGWTVLSGAALSAVTVLVLGTAPFTAFFGEHLARLADGSAFAFGEAWPEVADLITAGNQGVHGVVHKLGAMGVAGADATMAMHAGRAFSVVLLVLAAIVGWTSRGAGRHERAIQWLGLLGLASLASTGAWADYVPLTGVWLLALLAPLAPGSVGRAIALGVSAAFQVFLIGPLPIGDLADPSWMMPLSLVGALLLFATCGAGTLVRVPAVLRRLATARDTGPAAATPTD